MKPTTSVKPGNHIAATTIISSSHKMKYLSGQRESYSLSLTSRKRFLKRKLMYVYSQDISNSLNVRITIKLNPRKLFLPAKLCRRVLWLKTQSQISLVTLPRCSTQHI